MRWLWISAALALAVDQGSKYGLIHLVGLGFEDDIDVWPPYLILRRGLNTGMNFGLLAGYPETMRWVLAGAAVLISAGLVLWARSFRRPVDFAACGIAIGGALGNALDRMFHPGVIDFLNMSCCGIDNPYIFNLADVFIFAGLIWLVTFLDAGPRNRTGPRKRARREKGQ